MRRKTAFIILLLVLSVLLPCAALAASTPSTVYLCDGREEEKASGLPIDAIKPFKASDGSYCFCLPSGIDISCIRVYLKGGLTGITVNGEKVSNRSVTNAFHSGTDNAIVIGKTKYRVTVLVSSKIPSVFLNTKTGGLRYLSESKKVTEGGELALRDENGMLTYSDAIDYVRLRGNYSFQVDKKSFHIHLKEKIPVFGMKKAKTWLLLANYADNALVRDALAFDLAEGAGMPYTIDYRFCDMYLNNAYYGTFMLTEKVQTGNNRVNIPDLEEATQNVNSTPLAKSGIKGTNKYKPGTYKYYDIKKDPEDISGGYLIQLEMNNRYAGSTAGFVTSCGQAVLIKEPDHPSKAETQYIFSLVQSFENAISSPDGIDPDTGKYYSELADMDSMVSKYLVDEITKNLDGNKSSFYIYKYTDFVSTKLYFGPVWDYDNSCGNFSSDIYKGITNVPEGLLTGVRTGAEKQREAYFWFPKLYEHEDFRQAVKKAYRETFRPIILVLLGIEEPSDSTGRARSLDDWETLLSDSAAMNFSLWRTLNRVNRDFPINTGATYHETVDYVRNFLTARLAYLDSIWLNGD